MCGSIKEVCKMNIVFYGNRYGGIGDNAIRWWTSPMKSKLDGSWRDSYSHVELVFSDGMMFSASQHENRTRFARRNHNSAAWVEVTLAIDSYDEKLVRQFCENREGLKYDYAGVAGFVFGNPDIDSAWFCSEICVAALQYIGILTGVEASKVSPNEMYELLSKRN